MKNTMRRGLGFGLTSGIITTLGLIVGLNSTTNSKLVVIGGILIIAIADALSDAMGMHIAVETQRGCSHEEAWESTFSTFLNKFFFALTFLIPVVILPLNIAIIVSIIYGGILLTVFSYYLAHQRNMRPWKSILEHLFIAAVVIIVTHFLGLLIRTYFS